MKLLRHGPRGHERPGLVDDQGVMRDLSAQIGDILAADLAPARLARLRSVETWTLPVIPAGTRVSVPWHGMSKFVCVGLNYKDHAAESGKPLPLEPLIFIKPRTAVIGPNDPNLLPVRRCGTADDERRHERNGDDRRRAPATPHVRGSTRLRRSVKLRLALM